MTAKEYWHKPTGICVSEAFVIYECARGSYPRSEFEEVVYFGTVEPLSDRTGTIAPTPPGRRETLYGALPTEVDIGAIPMADQATRQPGRQR